MKTVFVELSKEKLDLIIIALSKMEYTEEECDKLPEDTVAGKAEAFAEELDIVYCRNFGTK